MYFFTDILLLLYSSQVLSDPLWPCELQHAGASLSLTINPSSLKFMSIELVMSSNHLIFQPSEILQNKHFYNSQECMVQIYSNTTSHGVIFLGSKITADGDCSHEIKRCLLLGRKTTTNLDSILKSRNITLLTKECLCFWICCLVGHDFSSKEQACFNFMSVVTICSDFGAPKFKVSHCFHCFLIYLPWSDGIGCQDLSFLNVEF